MAHMYPETGLVKDTSSDAERKVYNALKQTLDDNYYVFHSTLWVSPQDGGLLKNGEVDFIIIHPEHGILLLEAKGGDILIDGATKEWTSRDRFQVVHKIQDPFKTGQRVRTLPQAQASRTTPYQELRHAVVAHVRRMVSRREVAAGGRITAACD
jgi:hypothetical protein